MPENGNARRRQVVAEHRCSALRLSLVKERPAFAAGSQRAYAEYARTCRPVVRCPRRSEGQARHVGARYHSEENMRREKKRIELHKVRKEKTHTEEAATRFT